MKALPYKSVRSTKAYDLLLNVAYAKVPREVEEVRLPPIQVISVSGNEPPDSKQFQDAIGVLYGIGYGLKMGFKFRKLPRPKGYFDYRVGALETEWWSTSGTLDVSNAGTLRWKAYLMVPSFVSRRLVEQVRNQAKAKHPEIPYENARLEMIKEGRSVQVMHVGPYDQEKPTLDRLHQYVTEHHLVIRGSHHEIYISDPRRTKADKLRTVIRLAVQPERGHRRTRKNTPQKNTEGLRGTRKEAGDPRIPCSARITRVEIAADVGGGLVP